MFRKRLPAEFASLQVVKESAKFEKIVAILLK